MTTDSTLNDTGLYSRYRGLSLGVKILIWMGLGIVAGILFGNDAEVVQPIGDLFIRLLFMSAIPLVFFNLIAGVTSLANFTTLGRLGFKTLLYYSATTSIALCVGLLMASIMQPGIGIQLSEPVSTSFGTVPEISELILRLFPSNIFDAFSQGNIVQVVVFALFLGVTTLLLPEGQKEGIQEAFALLASLFRALVGLILRFAPIGVGALAAATVGTYGGAIFGPLAKFIISIWSAQMIMVVAYMIVLALSQSAPRLRDSNRLHRSMQLQRQPAVVLQVWSLRWKLRVQGSACRRTFTVLPCHSERN